MKGRRRLVTLSIGFSALALTLLPARVRGGVCGPVQPAVVPGGQSQPRREIPTNARILVFFPGPEATIYRTPLHITATATKVKFDGLDIALRDPAKRLVPADRVPLPSTTLPTLELRPQAPLTPKTRYELVVHVNSGEFILDELRTAAGPTTEPRKSLPESLAFEWVRYYTNYPCIGSACGPFAEFRLRDPGPVPGGLYEVHVLGADGEVHPGTLRTIVQDTLGAENHGRSIYLGRSSNGCWPQVDFQFPAAGKLQVGIRAVDLAGNPGPLVRVTVDLAHPLHTL